MICHRGSPGLEDATAHLLMLYDIQDVKQSVRPPQRKCLPPAIDICDTKILNTAYALPAIGTLDHKSPAPEIVRILPTL